MAAHEVLLDAPEVLGNHATPSDSELVMTLPHETVAGEIAVKPPRFSPSHARTSLSLWHPLSFVNASCKLHYGAVDEN